MPASTTPTGKNPERNLLEGFTCGISVGSLGYYMHAENTNEPHLVTLVEIQGGFSFAQQELAFELADLDGRRYGSIEAPILGQPAIWVTSTNEAEQTSKISKTRPTPRAWWHVHSVRIHRARPGRESVL